MYSKFHLALKRESKIRKGTFFFFTGEFEAGVDPGYEPRPCFDHDHPDFSDPGSPPMITDCQLIDLEDFSTDGKLSRKDKQLVDIIEKNKSIELEPLLIELLLRRHQIEIDDLDFTNEEYDLAIEAALDGLRNDY